jgi:hypothetical protein
VAELVSDSQDGRQEDGGEDDGLPIVLSPAVECPHACAREVHAVRLLGLKVKMLHQMLHTIAKRVNK